MLLPQASLTGPIVEFCVNVINDTGLAGVFLLMGAGSACIPIPRASPSPKATTRCWRS